VLKKISPIAQGAIAIVGRSCRLPGAPSVAALWELLISGGCAVSEIPADRWPKGRFGHPRVKERGRSYTWAAGVLDDVWGFDPGVFRISPREAEQIDPQQRLLLELVFEACEDAGFMPSKLSGSRTGVYIGASALDYSIMGLHDAALLDPYYGTGNALSIISNRISYIFDLHGPSLTIDTACSSSLVALHQACQALRHGEIESAIVGGVNILVSPFGFVSFSQATMLSPTGLCRAFSAEADGYVRSEGGVVLTLKTLDRALADGDRIHALLCGSGVNSDGRTSGISLPAEAYQTELLRTVYGQAGVAPDDVVYLEAHGTGTQVGDPAEATALGAVLGRERDRPLPIGSIKTNIGHTEPASGLAGLLKAMLVLEHNQAPKSLHFETPNPNIDFDDLNLEVVATPKLLPRAGKPRFVGVSSFGFGGTNAHVIVSDPPKAREFKKVQPRYLMLSAQSEAALRALAQNYADELDGAGSAKTLRIVAATNYRRERLQERLILPAEPTKNLGPALEAYSLSGRVQQAGAKGSAVAAEGDIVFVFSGNGSQWPGMGRDAYRGNKTFRDAVKQIDAYFAPIAGWSLAKELAAPSLSQSLAKTSFAQPLVFAIQVATVRALAKLGVRPSLTIGHSVGEVAAAEAAGALSLSDAVKVIFHRSHSQELTENQGGMTVVFGPREAAVALVSQFPALAVAAHNSHQCIVAAGPLDALDALAVKASKVKLRTRRLDLAYPFHTRLMEPVRGPLFESLSEIAPKAEHTPFLSTITAVLMPGETADARYWWRNVRDPVLFHEGIQRAVGMGKRIFVEIGPRATLRGHMRDAIDHLDATGFIDVVMDEKSEPGSGDPFENSAMRLLAAGARLDPTHVFGGDPGAGVDLPAYPWRRVSYRFGETTEATGAYSTRTRHPLIGARDNPDALEWRASLDTLLEPNLADHSVDGQTLLPGAAFIEMALAVARDWKGEEGVAVVGFEILQPLIFTPNATREILCRVSPSTSTVEIMSRPRLSKTAFVLHARGGILQKPSFLPVEIGPVVAKGGEDEVAIYERARRLGLEFGPAYRQLERAVRLSPGEIEVILAPTLGDLRYGLDPARLDSCFHGLILLFEDFGPRGGAFLPVRFEEIRLGESTRSLAGARIRIRRADARVIVADFELVDDRGDVAAVLHGARYQAVRLRSGASLAQSGLVRTSAVATSELFGAGAKIEWRSAPEPADFEQLSEETLLVEGWASAASLHLAQNLSVDGVLDLDELVLSGRLPARRRTWMKAVLSALESSSLLTWTGASYRLTSQQMPSEEKVLNALAAQYPNRAAELLIAARVGSILRNFGSGAEELCGISDSARDAFELRSASAAARARALGDRLDEIVHSRSAMPALRILQIGWGPAASRVLRFADASSARLTLLDLDPRRLERARLSLAHRGEIHFAADLQTLAGANFDLVVSAGGLSLLASRRGDLARLAETLAPSATLLAIEPASSLFQDLTLGLADDWFGEEGGRLRGPESWKASLSLSGFTPIGVRATTAEADSVIEISAERSGHPGLVRAQNAQVAGEAFIVRAESADPRFASSLKYALASRGAVCHEVKASQIAMAPISKSARMVYLPGQTVGDAVTRVAAHCLALRDLARALGLQKLKLYCPVDVRDRPAAEAVFSFLRTLANECPTLEIHRVEIPEYSSKIADELAQVSLSNTPETDIVLRPDGVDVLRYAYPEFSEGVTPADAPMALRLEKAAEGGLDRLSWRQVKRSSPGEREIEVEITATGLNFRDVMWSLSILPDEMLEDGFAGPTLGLEFSGRVVRVGDKVGSLKPGDDVVGFCGGAFSTHVTVDAAHVARLPDGVSCEAAATIPVAVLTAYYSLIFCADLQPDNWVLIHGGAGGVGLAALQIARWRGARTIVTAGTQEKRDLALALGADHAFDSRSSAFVDDVRRVTDGRGVSVVLNSLAGEAMERSLGLLHPFGRFVELGKRDYLANTPVGLRPFRRNLSYFGVDLDQLLSGRPDTSTRLFREVLGLFASGDLTPLPYTVFEGEDVIEAMRLMQQSGHIGKILVRPPNPTAKAIKIGRAFKVDARRTHVITGGFGGFGLAAALWLAERGARHLVLLGRSGPASIAAKEGLAQLARMGVETRAEAIDISDREAALALFSDLKSTMPPLAGVIHAAMVLDDAILANIDEPRLTEVLRPKIAGAEILDEAVRGMELDYFVLFSSATTVIGNPGQGAYVAANGYLEGLARRRRDAGLPALAIGWGAISDVGILARATSTKDSLAARSGVKAMTAGVALELMAEALAYDGGPAGNGWVVIADVNWSAARGNLPLLNSPTYAGLVNGNETSDPSSRGVVDLKDLAARLSPELARRAVADIVIEELARILRLPRDEVSKSKPLSEIGLDSLMAVELMLSLESRFGLDAPIGASAGGFNAMELSGHLLASQMPDAEAPTLAESLASKHLDASERVETAEFLGALQDKGVDLAASADRQPTSAK